jgi:hypothetical protein
MDNSCKINILPQGPEQFFEAREHAAFGAWIRLGLPQDLFLGEPGGHLARRRARRPPAGFGRAGFPEA